MSSPDSEYDEALEKLRTAIDATDAGLLKLLNQRADYARDVGQLKSSRGQELYAPSRERALLESLVARAQGPFPAQAVRAEAERSTAPVPGNSLCARFRP